MGSKGEFLSEDPVFLAIGTPKLTEILNRVNGAPNRDGQAALLKRRAVLEGFDDPPHSADFVT